MTPEWRAQAVAVCVPVRNEEAVLPDLLEALSRQQDICPSCVTVCFLLDGCDDASEDIVRGAAATAPFSVVSTSVASGVAPNAGRARRLALALGRSTYPAASGVALLTTDADTRPADDWIAANLRGLARADVVAGRILRHGDVPDLWQDRLESYYDRLYALRRAIDPLPWEGAAHHFTGGASLAFHAEAYDAVGGFEDCPCGEDAAIIDAACRIGLKVRRDRDVVVRTSSRHVGRAVGGLADHLRDSASGGAALDARLAHPADAAWQYQGHAAARAAYPAIALAGSAERLAGRLATDIDHVRRVAALTANAEAFATHVVPAIPGGERRVPLDQAEEALTVLERQRRERAA